MLKSINQRSTHVPGKVNILLSMGSKPDYIFFKLWSSNNNVQIDSFKNLLNNLELLVNFFLYKKVKNNFCFFSKLFNFF